MSSFNIYDNYNSFDDLFNRAELLEEKDFKSMVGSAKLRPEFAKYKAEDPKTGEKAAPGGLSRLANILFVTALGEAHLDILDQETSNILKGAKYSTSSTRIGQGLQELAPKAFEELFREKNPRSVEVSEYVNDPEKLEELIKDTVINYTRRDREYIKDIEPEDIADAVEDAVDDISDEVKIAQGLMSSGADQVKLDFDDVDVNIEGLENKDEVAAKIVKLINTKDNLKAVPTGVGINIEGPIGIFGSQTGISDMLTKIITSHFPDVSESEVKVTLNTNEEDYEEGPKPVEPVNEYEEDINDAEEDAEYKGKFSPKYAKKVEKEFAKHVRLRSPDGKLGVKLPPGNKGEIEDYKKRGYVEDNESDPDEAHHYPGYDPNRPLTAEQEKRRQEVNAEFKEFLRTNPEIEDNEFDDFDIGPQSDENVPDDYEEVLKAMVTKDKEEFAKNMIEDEEGGMRVLVAFAPEHSPEEMQANVDRYLAAAKKLGVKARAGKIDDEVAEVYVDAGPASKEMKLLDDLQRNMLQATGYFGGDEKLRVESTTAAYLTEQKQSDKRNKKTEVKNQSFKERYKPKTHWQLEELRRYGL